MTVSVNEKIANLHFTIIFNVLL